MFVLAQVVAIAEDEGLNVSWHSQNGFLLQFMEADLGPTFATSLNAIVEMDLELWPASHIVVETKALLHKILRVLIVLLKMIWSNTYYVYL